MRTLELKIPPPVVGALVALIMWWVSDLPPGLPVPAPARWLLVAAVGLAGLSFDVLGLLAFRQRGTTVNPLKPSKASALVTGGIYRLTRNPMYVGMALLLTAWAVHLGSLWPFLGPVVFVLYITRFQILPEERALRERFGHDYAAYAARVRRWL
jgi:protein-S-isoprenylcysteine O-methyltransferase Ste14